MFCKQYEFYFEPWFILKCVLTRSSDKHMLFSLFCLSHRHESAWLWHISVYKHQVCGQCLHQSSPMTRGAWSRHGRRLRVTYVTQVAEELEDLPDDLDGLVLQRRLRVEDEHVGGVAGPVGQDGGLYVKLLLLPHEHTRRRPGLAAYRDILSCLRRYCCPAHPCYARPGH